MNAPSNEEQLWAELDAALTECPDLEADPVLAEYLALAADRRRHATERPRRMEGR